MSLNKFMHPRNKYKTEPDFKQLAVVDENFRKVAITQLNGKVRIDFKNKDSLITLTKTLLKHDFNLDVDIPPMKLVPALPLRLNYILWIEDVLKFGNFCTKELESQIHGIDIGVGASCIYPLLISHQYNWKMTGTEIDPESLKFATKNVKQNNLQHLINLQLVKYDTILQEVVRNDSNFTFVMCNPPFFQTDDLTSKSNKKNAPRNAATGCERELIVEGGEQKFILRLIEDSEQFRDKIKIYTTMFGKKNTLSFVKRELAIRNISNFCWTEFCQGFTKRWGIAWTFLPEQILNLKNAPNIRTKKMSSKKLKESSCLISFSATENIASVDDLNNLFIQSIEGLNIKFESIDLDYEEGQYYAYELTAFEDNWSHARRKRRMAMRHEMAAKRKCEDEDVNSSKSNTDNKSIENENKSDNEVELKSEEKKAVYLKCNVLLHEVVLNVNTNKNDEDEDKSDEDEDDTSDKIEDKNLRSDQMRLRFIFEEGTGGKQALETLKQYFINKLNIRDLMRKNLTDKKSPKKKKKKKLKQMDVT